MDEDKINSNENPQHKKIVVVSGDGKELDISDVYNHLNIEEPNQNNSTDKKIIIPPDSSNK